ncbi:MAG TPA: SusC/RagA family TonB-linked outer membrane protein [Ohtaekwangia sp.]|nr:SusC/RagA family TonB-linked outer membrane protein [Ohtaekwangia sp.]
MRNFLRISFLCLLHVSVSWAQERNVSGKVTASEDSSPLPGVNVVVKGTTIGTVTDAEGNYNLAVPASGTTLVFSFIGLVTQEVEIGGRSVIAVSMSPDVKQLGEVVVTAAGIERETKSLGYAVQNIGGDKIAQKSEPDVLRSLQGKVAGVNILSTSGAPGSATRITIRGNKSFFGNNQPLFVVDGIPFDNTYNTSSNELTDGAAYGGRIADLDPNNIESINILPGGAAAALYGVRASNGVVVITTKAGSSRASRKGLEITYSTGFAIEQIANLPDYQNKYGNGSKGDYAEANGSWGPAFDRAGPGVNYNADGSITPNGSEVDSIPYWGSYAGVFPDRPDMVPYRAYPNNVKDFFRNGKVFDNSITIRGGNEKSVFTVVASRMKQEGYIPYSDYDKTNISVGGNTELENGFSIGGNMSYIYAIQNGPLSGYGSANQVSASVLSRILFPGRNWDISGQPFEDPVTHENVFFLGASADNPYYSAKYNGLRSQVNRIAASVNAGYDITDWLNVNYKIGLNTYTDRRKEVTRRGSVGAAGIGQLITDDITYQEIESNLLLTGNRDLNENFSLKAILGFNVNQRTGENQQVKAVNAVAFDIDDIDNFNDVTPFGGTYFRRRLMGLFGDVAVGYKDFLFLNLTGRNDWSSTLPESKRSFFYPSVSTSFVFTDAFDINPQILSSGKLRAAWSRIGNDAPVYSLYPTYNLNLGNSSGLIGSLPGNDLPFRGQPGATTGITVYDENLTPEFTSTIEFGADLQLFNNAVGLKVTYYDIRTTDQIAPIALADETGFNQLITNFGEMSNKGLEIGIDATPVKLSNGFTWTVYGTFTRNRNIVEKLAPGIDQIVLRNLYGGQVTPTLVAGLPYGALRGTYNVRDDEGNLLVDPATGLLIQSQDFKYIGDPNPKFLASLGTGFSYKGLTLSCLWNYRHGGDLYSATTQFYLGRGVTKDTEDREGYFIVPGVYGDTDTNLPILVDGQKVPNTTQVLLNDVFFQTAGGSYGINAADEMSIFDATVLRLSEVTVGYELPKALLSKTPFGSVSLTFTGRNLWYNAPNFPEHTNFDPETSSFGAQNYTGLEYNAAPSVKRYGVNLRVSF